MNRFQLLIDGRLTDSLQGRWGTSLDPGSGEQVATFAQAGPHDLEAAVAAARRAFDTGPWPRMTPRERAGCIGELAELMQSQVPLLARLEALDSGGIINRTGLDVIIAIRFLRVMSRYIYAGFPWQEELPQGSPLIPSRNVTFREPIGVCAAIIPWNFPLLMAVWKLGMALLTGNTMVLKPAEETPLTALKLGELISRTSIPAGVVNILAGPGRELGQALVRHPSIDRLAFTGSTAVGRSVMAESAATLKRVTLELGGKSANLILEDANMELALDGAVYGAFLHNGQVCAAGSRLLVPESRAKDIIEALVARTRGLRIGYQMESTTQLGPLINQRRVDHIREWIAIGRQEGARLVTGGKACVIDGYEKGHYLEPAIFTVVSPTMRIAREEIFGPVLSVMTYRTEEEAIRLANATEYGLAAGVWSRDIERARRLAAKLRAGTVWINDWHVFHEHGPFGGFGSSGIGRELGRHGLESYTELKHLHTGLEDDPANKIGFRLFFPRPATGFEQAPGPRVIAGRGAIARLGGEPPLQAGSRILLLTDRGVREAGLVERLQVVLGSRIAGIFDEIPQDSGLTVVDRASQAASDCRADTIVSLGGGSVLDTGKAVAIACGLGIRAAEVIGMNHLRGGRRFPHIVIPTTAGTGSEATGIVVLRHERLGIKVYLIDPLVIPDLAILDPALTLQLPPRLTAATAMDALTHAVEAYCSRRATPVSDAAALQAMRMIVRNLPLALDDPGDLAAREGLLTAAHLAGQAIQTAQVGLAHAMSHALGAMYGVPHGVANALVLPAVVRWNSDAPGIAGRVRDLAVDLHQPFAAHDTGTDAVPEAWQSLLHIRDQWCLTLWRDELESAPWDLAACARQAFCDPALMTNPRPVSSPQSIEELFREALASV